MAVQFTSAKTVDDVIEKYLGARGGKYKLAFVKSIYMEGIKELIGQEVIVKIIKEQDKLCRIEMETPVEKGFDLVTDKEAWTLNRLISPVAKKIDDEKLAGLQMELDIAGPLADYMAKGHKAELMGKETLEGNICYKIKLILKSGNAMMFWVDASTYLLYQSSATPGWEQGRANTEIFTLYKNYKEVDGIQFAHTLEITSSGTDGSKISEEIRFHTILVNPTIDPGFYQST